VILKLRSIADNISWNLIAIYVIVICYFSVSSVDKVITLSSGSSGAVAKEFSFSKIFTPTLGLIKISIR
jgi:hypothetical protein